MSYVYSLLNYIAATSKELGDSEKIIGNSPYMHSDDDNVLTSAESGLHGLTDDQKKLIGISTISVVTRLALVFKREDVHTF